jgi:DNA-binding GntR family transcriptional regulator
MPAPQKLTYADVIQIRRRVRRGLRISDLAAEYGVNRKTIRRRLDALAQAEAEEARRRAANRLRRQAAAERRKLAERERMAAAPAQAVSRRRLSTYEQWLRTPKNLSGRALAEANGLVRLRSPDGRVYSWREREEVEALLEAGWRLA